MEYCSGGDLYTRIHDGTLTDRSEVNWYDKKNSCVIMLLKNIFLLHQSVTLNNWLPE